jgi:antitoxin Phd
VDIDKDTSIDMTDDEKIDFVAARILKLYRPAFEELAK